jgi:hypothetical protein
MVKRKCLFELDPIRRCRRRRVLGHYVHKDVGTLVHFSINQCF